MHTVESTTTDISAFELSIEMLFSILEEEEVHAALNLLHKIKRVLKRYLNDSYAKAMLFLITQPEDVFKTCQEPEVKQLFEICPNQKFQKLIKRAESLRSLIPLHCIERMLDNDEREQFRQQLQQEREDLAYAQRVYEGEFDHDLAVFFAESRRELALSQLQTQLFEASFPSSADEQNRRTCENTPEEAQPNADSAAPTASTAPDNSEQEGDCRGTKPESTQDTSPQTRHDFVTFPNLSCILTPFYEENPELDVQPPTQLEVADIENLLSRELDENHEFNARVAEEMTSDFSTRIVDDAEIEWLRYRYQVHKKHISHLDWNTFYLYVLLLLSKDFPDDVLQEELFNMLGSECIDLIEHIIERGPQITASVLIL